MMLTEAVSSSFLWGQFTFWQNLLVYLFSTKVALTAGLLLWVLVFLDFGVVIPYHFVSSWILLWTCFLCFMWLFKLSSLEGWSESTGSHHYQKQKSYYALFRDSSLCLKLVMDGSCQRIVLLNILKRVNCGLLLKWCIIRTGVIKILKSLLGDL